MSQFVDDLERDGAADLLPDPGGDAASAKRVNSFLIQEAPKVHPIYSRASTAARAGAEADTEYSRYVSFASKVL